VFTSERDAPFTTAGFARMIERAGRVAKLKAHPHVLRHACGYALASRGHDTAASSPRRQEHPARGTLYSAVADAVQEILARRALAEVCVTSIHE
jgi:hypothetical protein